MKTNKDSSHKIGTEGQQRLTDESPDSLPRWAPPLITLVVTKSTAGKATSESPEHAKKASRGPS